jgi:small subunit ribosomal protein S20
MPRRRTSRKQKRKDVKRHLRNLKVKQGLKKIIKKFRLLVGAKQVEEARKLLPQVFSQLDKAAKKNIIHPASASRKKSRLARALRRPA